MKHEESRLGREVEPADRAQQFKQLGEHVEPSMLPKLDQALSDPSPQVRYRALEYYVDLAGPDAKQHVLDQLEDPDEFVRKLAFIRLGDFLTPDLLTLVEARLSDPSPQVRYRALEYYVDLAGPDATQRAHAQLTDSDQTVRKLAAIRLRQLEDHPDREDNTPPVFTQMPAAPPAHDERTYETVQELSERADPSSLPQLLVAFRSEDPMIRKLAVRGIGRAGSDIQEPELLAALQDPSDDVVLEALRIVVEKPTEVFRRALSDALEHSDERVQIYAQSGLEKLEDETEDHAADVEHLTPSTHAADEADPIDLVLALNVAAHHGEMSMPVRELLELFGRKRLTVAAIEELATALHDAGLRCRPNVKQLELAGRVRLTRTSVIPEFALRAHVDAEGPWTMPVRDLLRAFDRSRLTDRAIIEIAEALDYADLTWEPDISTLDPQDNVTVRRAFG